LAKEGKNSQKRHGFDEVNLEAEGWKPDGTPDFGEPVPDGLLLQ